MLNSGQKCHKLKSDIQNIYTLQENVTESCKLQIKN
jgi:hypothetical protein